MPSLRRAAAAALLVAATAGSLALAGCARSNGPTVITMSNPSQEASLTPLARGQARDAALTAAKAGWAAWAENDVSGMASYWSDQYVSFYRKLYSQYAAEGRKRIRKLSLQYFDVTDMDSLGDQVVVDANFRDYSYYVDRSGTPTKPTGKAGTAELTLDKQPNGSWKITNVIMAADVMK